MKDMTENEKFIFESIVFQIRMGFSSIDKIKENIVEEIEDNGFDKDIPQEWAFEQIEKEYEKLTIEAKRWIKPTDTEKLVRAFDELCDMNIIALHNAGYTMSDCECEVVTVEKELRKNKIVSDGYCFYHEQDLARAIGNEKTSLHIAFQKIENSDDAVTVKIGRKVAEVLKNDGFHVDWNETATVRILIPDFKWQHIFSENNRDLLDYHEVVKRMIKKRF